MTTRSKLVLAVATAVVAVIAGSIGYAYASPPATIHACYDRASGKLRFTNPATNVPKGCTSKEAAVDWDELGIAGQGGPQVLRARQASRASPGLPISPPSRSSGASTRRSPPAPRLRPTVRRARSAAYGWPRDA